MSNGEVEGPRRSAHQAPRAPTFFQRPRRGHTNRSRTPPTIVRSHDTCFRNYVARKKDVDPLWSPIKSETARNTIRRSHGIHWGLPPVNLQPPGGNPPRYFPSNGFSWSQGRGYLR